MPNNKLSSENKSISFFSEFIKNNISKEPIKVKSLMTPLQLIYNYYFGFKKGPKHGKNYFRVVLNAILTGRKLLNKPYCQQYHK